MKESAKEKATAPVLSYSVDLHSIGVQMRTRGFPLLIGPSLYKRRERDVEIEGASRRENESKKE